jgi:zinc transporter ZupT
VQFSLGFLVAVAVVSHDFCDGLSTLALMLNSGNSVKASLGMLFVSAVAPILGAATVLFVTVSEGFLMLTLSFLAGSFVYIGGFNLLPEAYSMNKPKFTAILFSTGFLVILTLSLISNS